MKNVEIHGMTERYPKGATASHLLSWSHIMELLKIDDPLERSFYERQTILLELGKGFTFVGRQYLPEREELRRELELTLREAEENVRDLKMEEQP